MKRAISIISAIIVLSTLVGAQDNTARSPEAGNAFNKGLDLAKKGDFKDAVPLFKEAIAADAKFDDAYYMLGICYKRINKYDEAIAAFKKSIEIDKKFERAYIALGNLQINMELFDQAINSFNAVVAFNDQSSKAHYGVGMVYYQMKDYAQAIFSLKKAVELNPNYDSAWNTLGLCQERENQLTDAIYSFTQAINSTKKNSSKGSYHYRLGDVQLKLKKYNEARDAFNNALKFSRSQTIIAGSNFGLGQVYKYLGQKQKAIDHFKIAARNRSWKASADYEIDLILNPEKYSY